MKFCGKSFGVVGRVLLVDVSTFAFRFEIEFWKPFRNEETKRHFTATSQLLSLGGWVSELGERWRAQRGRSHFQRVSRLRELMHLERKRRSLKSSRIFDSQVLKRQAKMEEKQQRRRHPVRHLRRVQWHPKSFGYLKGFEKS